MGEYQTWSFEPDKTGLSFALSRRISLLMARLAANPDDTKFLRSIVDIFEALKPVRLDLDLWKSQNIYFSLSRNLCRNAGQRAAHGEAAAKAWLSEFNALGGFLRVNPAAILEK